MDGVWVINVPTLSCHHGLSDGESWNIWEIEEYLENDSSGINSSRDYLGNTPLVAAVLDCRCPIEVIRLMLRYGADVNSVCPYDRTPLTCALQKQRDEAVIGLLLENGADVFRMSNDQSVLCFALQNGGSRNVVQLLLDAGCPPDSCVKHGSALHCITDSLSTLCKDIIDLLIERGTNMNAVNPKGYSVMCHAMYLGFELSWIEMLSEAGIPLNVCNIHASSLLCATDAPIVGHEMPLTKKHIEFLLCKGAPLHKVNANGLSPLQSALKSRKYEVDAIRLLFQLFPDGKVVDNDNNNLLHFALGNTLYGCEMIIAKLLVKAGVSVHTRNVDGVTPLHLAAKNERCSLHVVEFLLESGAAVNVESVNGETPLEISANSWIHFLKMKVLFAAGACLRVNKSQQSLLEKVLIRYDGLGHLGFFYMNHIKIVLQYSLLDNPYLDIESLIKGHKDYDTFSKCWKDFKSEVQRMESVTVGEDCTLREFLHEYGNYNPEVEKYDCDTLLKIKLNAAFPFFSNIISDKVGRCVLQAKIREMQVYTVRSTTDKACLKEIIYLDYLSVCEIVRHSTNANLLSLIAGFTFMDCKSQDSAGANINNNKRSAEGFTEHPKQKKLASK